jgi:hypothetical protein
MRIFLRIRKIGELNLSKTKLFVKAIIAEYPDDGDEERDNGDKSTKFGGKG